MVNEIPTSPEQAPNLNNAEQNRQFIDLKGFSNPEQRPEAPKRIKFSGIPRPEGSVAKELLDASDRVIQGVETDQEVHLLSSNPLESSPQ